MNSAFPAPHIHRRRSTPWPVRIFLVIAVLFGIWVDINEADLQSRTATSERIRAPVQDRAGADSVVDNIIQTLASRR